MQAGAVAEGAVEVNGTCIFRKERIILLYRMGRQRHILGQVAERRLPAQPLSCRRRVGVGAVAEQIRQKFLLHFFAKHAKILSLKRKGAGAHECKTVAGESIVR